MKYKGFLKNLKKGSLAGVTAADVFVVEKPNLTKAQVFDEANTFSVSPSTIPATQTNHVPQFGQIGMDQITVSGLVSGQDFLINRSTTKPVHYVLFSTGTVTNPITISIDPANLCNDILITANIVGANIVVNFNSFIPDGKTTRIKSGGTISVNKTDVAGNYAVSGDLIGIDYGNRRSPQTNVSGAVNLDVSLYGVFDLTLTAATDFTFINLPTGDFTKPVTIYLTGAFAWTLAQSVEEAGSDAYAGATRNRIQVDIINGSPVDITHQIQNL